MPSAMHIQSAHLYCSISNNKSFSLNLPQFSPFGINDLNAGLDIYEMITNRKNYT